MRFTCLVLEDWKIFAQQKHDFIFVIVFVTFFHVCLFLIFSKTRTSEIILRQPDVFWKWFWLWKSWDMQSDCEEYLLPWGSLESNCICKAKLKTLIFETDSLRTLCLRQKYIFFGRKKTFYLDKQELCFFEKKHISSFFEKQFPKKTFFFQKKGKCFFSKNQSSCLGIKIFFSPPPSPQKKNIFV